MRVGVVGSGLLGTTTALLLARRGLAVDLIDARPGICQGASATGEGKIHLGYVYALAESETVAPIVSGALQFDAIIERALGRSVPWSELVSSGFTYVVHPDSLASPAELATHYSSVHESIAARADGLTYLGVPADQLRLPREVRVGNRGMTAFATDERSVDVVRLFALMDKALSASAVTPRMGHTVTDAHQWGETWRLDAHTPGGAVALGPYDVVVNAAWDQQDRLDRCAFPELVAPVSNYRLRAFAGGRSRSVMPVITVVQGPFGDLVGFAGGRFYASWYPDGLLGFSTGHHPPEDWARLAEEASRDGSLARRMLAGLADVVPMDVVVDEWHVQARVVVAHGDTDIDHRDSRLHHRLGPTVSERDRWVTPRSPKLTNAPQVAQWTCDVIKGLFT